MKTSRNINVAFAAILGDLNLPVNLINNLVLKTFGCNKKMLRTLHNLTHGECLEYAGSLSTDLLIRSHKAEICIQ